MKPGFRFPVLVGVATAWNVPTAVALIALAQDRHGWGQHQVATATAWMAALVIAWSLVTSAGVEVGARWFARSSGVAARRVTSAAGAYSAAFWPLGVLVGPGIGSVIIVGAAYGAGPGLVAGAFSLGQLIALLVTPMRVVGRLFRLQAGRTLARVRALYPEDGVCRDCGLPIASQSVGAAPMHPAAWLIPMAFEVALVIGLSVGVVLTMPSSGRIGGFTIWWSWRGAALLALPVYLVFVAAWVGPRWVVMRPIRLVRAARLAKGTCVLCEHGLAARDELGLGA